VILEVLLLPPVPEKPSINPTRWCVVAGCGGLECAGWVCPPCFSGLTRTQKGRKLDCLQQRSGALAVCSHVPPDARPAATEAALVAGGWQTTGVSSSVQAGAPLLVALRWGGIIGVVIAPSFPEPCHRNLVTPQSTCRWAASYALLLSPFPQYLLCVSKRERMSTDSVYSRWHCTREDFECD
jgi:hypothetical protein